MLALLLIASTARAAAPFTLRYQPNATACPTEVEAAAAIEQRTFDLRVAPTALRMELETTDDGAEGTLTVELPRGALKRTLEAASCRELVDGLALVAAMLLRERAAETSARDVPARRWRVVVGAQVVVEARHAPTPLGGLSIFVETSPYFRWWRPSLRLGLGSSTASPLSIAQGEARFSSVAGHADLCPLGIAATSRLEIFACAGVEVGALLIDAGSAGATTRTTNTWIAPRVLGRARLLAWRRIQVEAQVFWGFPLLRSTFFVPLNAPIYTAPTWTLGAAVGVGVAL